MSINFKKIFKSLLVCLALSFSLNLVVAQHETSAIKYEVGQNVKSSLTKIKILSHKYRPDGKTSTFRVQLTFNGKNYTATFKCKKHGAAWAYTKNINSWTAKVKSVGRTSEHKGWAKIYVYIYTDKGKQPVAGTFKITFPCGEADYRGKTKATVNASGNGAGDSTVTKSVTSGWGKVTNLNVTVTGSGDSANATISYKHTLNRYKTNKSDVADSVWNNTINWKLEGDGNLSSGTRNLGQGDSQTYSSSIRVNNIANNQTVKKCQYFNYGKGYHYTVKKSGDSVSNNHKEDRGSDKSGVCVSITYKSTGPSEEPETGTDDVAYSGEDAPSDLDKLVTDSGNEKGYIYYIYNEKADKSLLVEDTREFAYGRVVSVGSELSDSDANSRGKQAKYPTQAFRQTTYNSSNIVDLTQDTPQPYVPHDYPIGYKICGVSYSQTYDMNHEQMSIEEAEEAEIENDETTSVVGEGDEDGDDDYDDTEEGIVNVYTYSYKYTFDIPTCYSIAKKPNARIINGGLYSDSDVKVSKADKSVNNNNKLGDQGSSPLTRFGSWAEYLVNVKAANNLLASGATLINGGSTTNTADSPLSIANTSENIGYSNISAGNFLERMRAKYEEKAESGPYDVKGDETGVVFVKGDINISSKITTVNAWLIADGGNINTCSDENIGEDLSANSKCANELKINGLLYATGNIYFNRAFGAEHGNAANSAQSAEIINLGATTYREAFENARQTGESSSTNKQATTVYITELAPRQ